MRFHVAVARGSGAKLTGAALCIPPWQGKMPHHTTPYTQMVKSTDND
jgi:hypothetical protein